jgi:hypothetical protein
MLKKVALVAASFATGVVLTLISVGYSAPTVSAQDDAVRMAAIKAQVMTATYQLDKAGLHAVDEGAKAGTIASGALGEVRRARIAIQATEWPDALKSMAANEVVILKSLEEALRTEDASKVMDPATRAHDTGHDLSAAVYTWLDTGTVPSGSHGH